MALDGRVMVEQFEGTMMGAPFKGHGMSGYDNVTGKYWSTWNDSMSTGLMVSTGTCDAQNACTFEGTYNARPRLSPDGKQLAVVHLDRGNFRIAIVDLQTLFPQRDGVVDLAFVFEANR